MYFRNLSEFSHGKLIGSQKSSDKKLCWTGKNVPLGQSAETHDLTGHELVAPQIGDGFDHEDLQNGHDRDGE